MREIQSDFGRVLVGARADLFAEALKLTLAACAAARPGRFLWALTGGSTPASFYQWCAENGGLPSALLQGTDFTVSDERHVLLSSSESNFGNAERQLLAPLGVSTDRRHPWMVAWPVAEAAEAYRRTMLILAGPGRAYDLCFWAWAMIATPPRFFPARLCSVMMAVCFSADRKCPARGGVSRLRPAVCGRAAGWW